MKKEVFVKVQPKEVFRALLPAQAGFSCDLLDTFRIFDKEIEGRLVFICKSKGKKKKVLSLNMDALGFFIETELVLK